MSDVVKQLPHRNWPEVRDTWVSHLPLIDLDQTFPEPTMWDLPEAKERLFPPQPEMPYFPGARECVFREAILLSRKFTYCRKVAWQSNHQGFPTWSVVAAYDACFYGAKAFCCFLGIASLNRDSKWFVDVLATQTIKVGNKKEDIPVLRAYDLKARLSHELLWRVTSRLVRTLSLPSSHESLLKASIAIDFESVSKLRNNIVYHGGFWISHKDLDHCDLARQVTNLGLLKAMSDGLVVGDIMCRYFELAKKIGDLLTCFLDGIAELAPSFAKECTSLSDWKTTSSL